MFYIQDKKKIQIGRIYARSKNLRFTVRNKETFAGKSLITDNFRDVGILL